MFDIDIDNFAPVQIALQVAKLFNLGLCEVQVMCDKLNVPHVIDIVADQISADTSCRFGFNNFYKWFINRVDFG